MSFIGFLAAPKKKKVNYLLNSRINKLLSLGSPKGRFDLPDSQDNLDSYDPNKLRTRTIKRDSPEISNRNLSRVGGRTVDQLSPESRLDLGFCTEGLNYSTIDRMNRDPVIAFSYAVISSIIRSLPYTISCDDKLQKQILEDSLKQNYNIMLEGLLTAIYNGFAFGQKIWGKKQVVFTDIVKRDDGTINTEIVFKGNLDYVRKLKFIDPNNSTLQYWIDILNEELVYVSQETNFSVFEDNKVYRNNLIWFATGTPFDKIFGRSRYINIAKEWEITIVLLRYLLEELDRNASPPVEVGYPEGNTYDPVTLTRVENALLAKRYVGEITSQLGYIKPNKYDEKGNPLWSVKILDNWTTSGAENIREHIKFYNVLKTIGLFLPSQFSPFQVKGNSSGAGELEVALEMFMFTQESLLVELEDTISRDYLDDVLMMNIPRQNRVNYDFRIDRSIFNRRQLMKDLVITLLRLNGQMLTSGKGIPREMPDLRAIFEQLNIPFNDTVELFYNLTNSDENQSPEAGGLLDDDIQEDKDNDENRQTERTPRKVKDGNKETIIPGA